MKPIQGVEISSQANVASSTRSAAPGFKNLVETRVSFSRHAAERMQARNITLSGKEMALLHQAMGEAKATGAKQAAIVMDPGIFIVAPQNGTVITTVSQAGIDSMQTISNVDALVVVGRTSSEGVSSPRPTDGGQPAPVHWSLIHSMED
ncbi:flagellar hook associated protein [Sulfobacillus harzensis]|uniref:Flagellar hook associated protein n=1 Tax=Sulfobacillus harzensis TaxID=2729629 RepID=A0A7Y0Q3M8_9FIRM|nr:flagellar hook associated protein [Sulfobacillus harzensis]NMP23555.1 flagellar hook associated protein [Sulfobacillus harzensis]